MEDLLQNRLISKKDLNRSQKIIQLINKNDISKYNLQNNQKIILKDEVDREKILVLGQVETDNSILFGVPPNKITDLVVLSLIFIFIAYYLIYIPYVELSNFYPGA